MRRRNEWIRSIVRRLAYAGLMTAVAAHLINLRWRFAWIGGRVAVGVAAGSFVVTEDADGPTWWLERERESFRVLPYFAKSGPLGFLVVVPIWIVIALLSATAYLAHRGLRRIPAGHCQACGYNLTGNTSGRCPECGEPIGAKPGA